MFVRTIEKGVVVNLLVEGKGRGEEGEENGGGSAWLLILLSTSGCLPPGL